MEDLLYGRSGIDTSYEREILTYRPEIKYTKEQIQTIVRTEVQQTLERSRTFTISHNLLEYGELIEEINQMLLDLEERNSSEHINQLKSLLEIRQFQEINRFEKDRSGYQDTGDFELYSMLYQMKESIESRIHFIDEKFRTQITNETDIQKIEEAELSSIEEWEQLEAMVMDGYKQIAEHNHHDDHGGDDNRSSHFTYELLDSLEKEKRKKELFHTSLADTSYVHRNRYFMFLSIIEKAKILIYDSESLINHNLQGFLLTLKELEDLSGPKAHLVLQFKKLRDKYDALKGRMMTIDDEKESFGSEKNFLYQQLETKTIEPLKNWLHNQVENVSGALDKFSSYLVDSMQDTRTQYEKTLADLINFYKSEADFYEQQIQILRNKEEIRKFYRILEDLEEQGEIQPEWIVEYLKNSGYET